MSNNSLGDALDLRRWCRKLRRVSYNINTRADRQNKLREEEETCTYRRSPCTRNGSFTEAKAACRQHCRIETHRDRREIAEVIRQPKLCLEMSAGQREKKTRGS